MPYSAGRRLALPKIAYSARNCAGRIYPSQHSTTSVLITVVTFLRKKSKLKSFPECHFFENTRTNFKLNLVIVLVLVLNLKLSNVVEAKKSFIISGLLIF